MDSTAPIPEAPLPHRSTKACQRCKRKKIRCRYLGSHINTCTACEKSGSECLFDFGTEKLHAAQGSEYIAALEARVKLLEQELATRGSKLGNQEGSDLGNIGDDTSTPALTPTPTKVTLFTIAQRNRVPPSGTLPPQHTADQLFDTAYRYTLARYCILDWVRVRKWHENREAVCFASHDDDIDLQLGAFFLWIVYAIGAQLTPNTQNTPELYYDFATGYLQQALQQQGAITVQALLALVQYHFRAPTGPSLWQLAGAGMRLCIELGYHQRQSPLIHTDPYKLELEKRLFWCSYCFDRIVSIMLRRPFGIQDIDITCNTPANVDDYCTNREVLQSAQMLDGSYTTTITTLSASLHHLQIYRIRSRILTTYANPEFSELNSEDIFKQIEELETWRQNSPSCPRGSGIPYQSSVRIDSIYYQALMLLFRPIIAKSTVEERLLLSCASLSIDACEAMRRLSLDVQTQNSPITVYNCFRCGVTLLQCVTLQRNILPMRRIMHAIIACSGALTVYTRTLALALPFLELFDKLSDYFLSAEEYAPPTDLHSLLQYVTRSDPSEIPQILDSLSNTTIEQTAGLPLEQMEPDHFDFLFGMDPALCFPMDTMTPNSTAAALSDVMNTNELWRDIDG